MEQINDISFLLDKKQVVLLEHQSTPNENMPLRLLMYIGRVYEKILTSKDIYRSRRITIPRPNFIVLYNVRLRLTPPFTSFTSLSVLPAEAKLRGKKATGTRNTPTGSR
jgi:hypothetical protein